YRRGFVLAMSADAQPFNLIEHLVEYIVQSAARPSGAQGRALRRWYALTLQRCCDALVNNTNVTPAYEAFPDIRSSLSYPRPPVHAHLPAPRRTPPATICPSCGRRPDRGS